MPVTWRVQNENLTNGGTGAWADPDGRTVRTPSGAVLPGPRFRGAEDVPEAWDQGGLTRFQYAGAWAHALIGFDYARGVPSHDVFLDCSFAQLARMDGIEIPLRENAMRPDIWDRTTNEIWEIKPTTALRKALREVDEYLAHLVMRTPVRRGQSHIEGRALLPGRPGARAELVYDMRMPGTVRYEVLWRAGG